MTHGRLVCRVDQDVDDQGHEEEHIDEASLKPRELFPLSPATVRLCRLLICAQARKVQRHKVRPGRHFQRMPLDLSQITFNRSFSRQKCNEQSIVTMPRCYQDHLLLSD